MESKKRIDQLLAEAQSHVDRFGELLESRLQEFGSEYDTEYIQKTFLRSMRLYRASSLLVAEGMPGEALLLARALVESALTLRQVADADEVGRKGLVLGWWDYTAARQIGDIEQQSVRAGLPNAEWKAERERLEMQIAEAESGSDLKRTRFVPHAKYGDSAYAARYVELLVLHQFIHGSALASTFFDSSAAPDDPEDLSRMAMGQTVKTMFDTVLIVAEVIDADLPTTEVMRVEQLLSEFCSAMAR